jgi:phi13 family phage major tail protein
MPNKIVYGLSNAHVWPITATSDAGVPTYGEVINMPGSVELSLDAEGSSDPFHADDGIYYQSVSNSGYSGSITLADIPQAFLTTIMKEVTDKNGAHIENADIEPLEFAIAFEFKGDASKRRHVFYRCKATRPSIASSTKEDSIAPNTQALNFTAMPRLDTKEVKAWCEEGDACFSEWYGTTPYTPDYTA